MPLAICFCWKSSVEILIWKEGIDLALHISCFGFMLFVNFSHSIGPKQVIAVSKVDFVDWNLIRMPLSTGPWAQAKH